MVLYRPNSFSDIVKFMQWRLKAVLKAKDGPTKDLQDEPNKVTGEGVPIKLKKAIYLGHKSSPKLEKYNEYTHWYMIRLWFYGVIWFKFQGVWYDVFS